MFQITAAGNIGKDAVLRHTQSGDKVTSFSVGCKVRKGREQVTEWLSCSIWGDRGETLASYLTKGQSVTVTGALSTREHEGKTYLECRVSEVALQGGRRDEQQAVPQRQPQRNDRQQPRRVADDLEDDIPFD